jgi:plasmid stability protein
MTLTIHLPEPVERRLAERAAKDGKSVEALASELLEQAVAPEREETLDEILAPVRQEFAAQGITEEEWDAMIEEAREEIWQEKHGKKS